MYSFSWPTELLSAYVAAGCYRVGLTLVWFEIYSWKAALETLRRNLAVPEKQRALDVLFVLRRELEAWYIHFCDRTGRFIRSSNLGFRSEAEARQEANRLLGLTTK